MEKKKSKVEVNPIEIMIKTVERSVESRADYFKV